MPPTKDIYINDLTAEMFDITNFKYTKVNKIKEGFQCEIVRRNDIDVNTTDKMQMLDQFLEEVIFVVDRYEKADYIRSIIEFKNVDNLIMNF